MAVSPNQGSTGGGDAVTLTGSHFTGTTGVRYGSRQAATELPLFGACPESSSDP